MVPVLRLIMGVGKPSTAPWPVIRLRNKQQLLKYHMEKDLAKGHLILNRLLPVFNRKSTHQKYFR
jgi:hypothetical protein